MVARRKQFTVVDGGTVDETQFLGEVVLVDDTGAALDLHIPVTWTDVTGKPAVIAAGATEAEAQVAIGIDSATTTTEGLVLQSEAQADSTATDVAGIVTDFNALLAKLRAAGIVAP